MYVISALDLNHLIAQTYYASDPSVQIFKGEEVVSILEPIEGATFQPFRYVEERLLNDVGKYLLRNRDHA